MKRTIGAGAILALLCGGALAGCGSGGSDDAASTTTAASAATATTTATEFLTQVNALCDDLNQNFAAELQAALAETRNLANVVQTTDPEALTPVYDAAAEGFGQAAELVSSVKTEFADLDAPADATATITSVETALDTLGQMLTDVQEAAAARDLAGFGAAVEQLSNLDQAQLDAAAQDLADIGATECQPAS